MARAHTGEVLFFGVAWHGTEDDCRAYQDEFDVPYASGLDADERVFRSFNVPYQPATVLISRDGAIAHTNHGPIHEDDLEQAIEKYLL